MRKKKPEPVELTRTKFPIEPIALTPGQLQASASFRDVYARTGDTITWRCLHPLKNGHPCPFTATEKATSTGYQDFPDVMIIHIWEEGHYEMSKVGSKIPIIPGKPRTRDDMLDEPMENVDEAHKDLTIALDRYARENREIIDFLRKNG